MMTQNGHLIFQSGTNHNITFRSSGGGAITVDGENIRVIAQSVRTNKQSIDRLRTSQTQIPPNLNSRLNSLQTSVNNLQSVQETVRSLRSSVSTLTSNMNSGNTRLTSAESRISTGQSQLSSRLTTVENRITSLTSSTSNNLVSRVRALEQKVSRLETLLTTNECQSNPCLNGGTCLDTFNGFICRCPNTWTGIRCDIDVNECSVYAGTDLGCQNGGTCVNSPGSFSCTCTANWHGIRCMDQHDDCTGASQSELCGHGTCVNIPRASAGQAKYQCICDDGWTKSGSTTTAPCTVDVDECSATSAHPCSRNPFVPCNNYPGGFNCGRCPAGYTGNGFTCQDVNECERSNGGCSMSPFVQCQNTIGSFSCPGCPGGYQGDGRTCTWVGICGTNNGGCYPTATCRETPGITGRSCTCPSGYVGNGVGPNGCTSGSQTGACLSNPCQNGAACINAGSSYRCQCMAGYTGTNCETDINECASNPCQNGGTCTNLVGRFQCACTEDFTGDTCTDAQSVCGGRLSGETGTVRFPRQAGTNYSHGVSCAWTITTTRSKIINVRFPTFDIESHIRCNFDFLQINDGPTATSYAIGRYCGGNIPPAVGINSTHNQIYLWFFSDTSVSGRGFVAEWTSADPVCGGDLSGSNHGSIKSPGYPGVYPHNRDCSWMVSVSPGKRIMFTFATLQLENHANCSYDYLEILDPLRPSDAVKKYCSTSTPPPFTTLGPSAVVKFHSDSSLNDRGFHITYAAVNSLCGGQFTQDRGTIVSPNYPNAYNHNAECVWTITVSQGDTLTLTFTTFDLETGTTCSYDFVEIRDGISPDSNSLGRFCGRDNPAPVQSTGNQMYIVFSSDASITGVGFQAMWNVACGGTFTTPTGTLQSPSYPNSYPHDRECIYIINLPVGNRVTLTFAAFNLEGPSIANANCSYDYLEIRDGGSMSNALLGLFCGTQIPANQVSTQNMMWLKFRTDGSVSNTGFQATYTSEVASCGGSLTEDTGRILSPGHPNVYPHGVNCTWYITVTPGMVIRLTFHAFSIEANQRCAFDYVAIYDNSTAVQASLLGKFCGSTRPMITSSDNVLTMVFRTDSSIAHIGFSASYVALNASTLCGSTLTDLTGVITSPNYPGNYPHQRECVWIITVAMGNQILLNVTDFSMEFHTNCQYDYLEIRNGKFATSPLVGRYCGTTIDEIIRSHSNSMWIKFKTDTSFSSRGFSITYDGTSSGCGADMTTPTGSFISPNYPLPYNHNAECFWTITVSRGSSINLAFIHIDIESHSTCRYDYIQVRDGSAQGREVARLCGTEPVRVITSTSNKLWIKFRSDSSVSGNGFSAVYSTVCNNVLTSFSGVIESPNFPNRYPHNRNCTWIIQTTLGNTVNVSFSHFDIESHSSCRYDRLQVRDGNASDSAVIANLCGTTIPDMISSSGKKLLLNFMSDASMAGNGFRLEWITDGCGGYLTGTTGTFTSPNYPKPYPHRRECVWRITVATGMAIQLTIGTFDLETHTTCRYDVLEVYGGPDDSAPRLAQLCHRQSTPQVLTNTGNTMFVRFRSDFSINGKGFTATYQAVAGGCGGNYSTPSGTIVSKNYPQNYPHNTDCQWLITVAQNQLIVLTFVDFDVESTRTCRFDYVGVYDGPDSTSPELVKHCGTALPSPSIYRSTSNQLYIRMRTDVSVSAKGFKANYITGCGGIRNATTDGEITSPNYPGNYQRLSNCTWLIQAPHSRDKVTLTFTHMDLESAGSCTQDYVRVLDGNDASAPEVGGSPLCGNTVPAPIISQGNRLFVTFVTDGSIQLTGFRATYTKSASSCGGDFTAEHGTFTSPAYPNSYPRNTECVWTLHASPGNRLLLSFSTFSLVSSSHCNSDYLEVREGDVSGRLIGRYCGRTMPGNITAVNGIWMKFRSNSRRSSRGFSATYNSVYGGALTGSSGQLASPLYPRNYPHNSQYTWMVTVPVGKRIRVTFVTMNLEGLTNGVCVFDYVKIQDGALATSPELAKYCGTTLPSPLITTTNQMRVVFHTDSYSNGQGFLFNWQATEEVMTSPTPPTSGTTPIPGCGGDLVAGNFFQTVESPGYPDGYANSLNCVWRISSVVGTRISVNITYIDLEGHSSCHYDSVTISDGTYSRARRLGSFCGRQPNTSPLVSRSNSMRIRFKTDGSVNRTGFSLQYKTECGGIIGLQSTGVLESPNYPSNYPANQNCSWVVAVKIGRTVQARFNGSFNIQSTSACDSDYIMLLNGADRNSPPLGNGTNRGNTAGRYCGNSAPATMETSSNKLFVNFVSDGSGAGPGFQLIYSEMMVTCGGHLTLTQLITSGTFTSPNYPGVYPHNVDCMWVITAPATERIQLDFDNFNLEQNGQCAYDYVEVRDGGTQNAPVIGQKLCGTNLPSTIITTGNVMYIRLRTDNSIPRSGFSARYSIAVCGGRINGARGTIMSPNYPGNYEANSDCEWIISAPVGHYITFSFSAFQLEYSSSNCTNDYLEIREINSTGPVILRNCGTRMPSPVDTSDSFAYVRFVSNGNTQRTGFKLTFLASVEACGGDLTTSTGTFSSPNYPGQYAHNRLCEWRIQVQPGRRVTLTFSDFRIELHRSCSWDYVDVFNGLSRVSPHIIRLCGVTTPAPVESSGNSLRVVFKTDGSITNGGFRATYTSNNEAVCGGSLTSPGNITSPGYTDGNYTSKLYCVWTVSNPSLVNSSIKVSLPDLHLEHHSRCLYDVLEIREGSTENGVLLKMFCGNNTIPRPFVTPSPQLFIRFKTDFSIVDRGFYLEYDFQECGGLLTTSSGVITSPNYPNFYNNNEACAWQIIAPEGTQIRIIYDDMAIENHTNCRFDFLEILNGGNPDSPSIGKSCDMRPPTDFLSQSNSLRIIFQSDFSITSRGFKIRYQFETEACGGLFHSNDGFLASPNFPHNYPHNTECLWDINVQPGYIVSLTFNPPFDLEAHRSCRYDYVEVSDSLSNRTLVSQGRWCSNQLPAPVTSSGNRLVVKFRSDISTNGNGFSANWTVDCGGTFTADKGVILSPGYPVAYSNNLRCNYTIMVDPQKFILAKFDSTVYEIESGGRCNYDSVQMFAGNDTSGRRLGRFCGTTVPQPVSALGTMYMQFWTDATVVMKGFKIKYIAEACGGVYTEPYGRFHTPTTPSPYHHNANCTWLITVTDNMIIQLKFNTFKLEASSRCSYDSVTLYDGNSLQAPQLGRFCGPVIPDIIRTTGNTMLVNFLSDGSVAMEGFTASYFETYGPAHGCGGILNRTSGAFSSVDGNNDWLYENNLDCKWTILVGDNKLATLNITAMDIERHSRCAWDYLAVYDGISTDYPLIGKYCQNTTTPRFITGSTNALLVYFHTDSSIVRAGFNATYGQQNALCGGVFTANVTARTISTPNYPRPAGQFVRCRWTIDSSSPSKQVRLTFTGLSLIQDSRCSQEYVELRDFPMGLTGRSVHYCGSTIPPSFDSAGRTVQINYNIPASSTSGGFQMTYEIATCSKNFTSDNGRITSPGYPGNYPRNMNCDILIMAPSGSTLALYFTQFYIERHSRCRYDYLRVYNGTSANGTMLVQLCGPDIPDTVYIPSNTAYLKFKTDASVNHRGYDISFVSTTAGLGCGGNLTGINGSLTSPGFPSNYSSVATCTWRITVPARRVISLTFTMLGVPGVSMCSQNYVAIYNGNSDSAQIFGRYCDSVPASLTTSSNSAFVKFVSTGSSAAPTFRLTYTS
ncbi:cubilin-like [Gigantopelta aegis]|uniref:cubilin-like n=1 Tax=Gigantopelta aegis TaxID=1735272 RepID=UPI001B88A765|nr:cubilin-like [Gigantopelta aegis]